MEGQGLWLRGPGSIQGAVRLDGCGAGGGPEEYDFEYLMFSGHVWDYGLEYPWAGCRLGEYRLEYLVISGDVGEYVLSMF